MCKQVVLHRQSTRIYRGLWHSPSAEPDPVGACRRAACTVANVTGCFKKPAHFKRVYLVDMSAMDSNGFVKKLAYIDLLDIQASGIQ